MKVEDARLKPGGDIIHKIFSWITAMLLCME
jgi:hypothetical protein